MYITHESQEQLKKDILRILNKHLDLREYRVFFFGSRVKKKCNDRSDIDLGIEGQNPVSAEAWQNIKEEKSLQLNLKNDTLHRQITNPQTYAKNN